MILTMLLARSGIAKLVLAKGKHQLWLGQNKWAESESDGCHLGHSLHQHSGQVLRVSRQVYNEGLPILYGGNKFDFTAANDGRYHHFWGPMLKNAIGEVNAKLIRHMLVRVASAHVVMQELSPYLPNLQSVELHIRYASDPGSNRVFETGGAEAFQKAVEKIVAPSAIVDLPGVLCEDQGIRYSLVLNMLEVEEGSPKRHV